METPIYTKHTEEELIKAYSQVKGNAEFVNYFIDQYNQAFDDYVIHIEDSEEMPPERALNFCFEFYMPVFLEQLHKGHSFKWAYEFSTSPEEDVDSVISNTYDLIKKMDSLWAQNELIIYCKSLGITDPMQVNYYINLIDAGYRSPKEGIEKSGIYVDIFKRELAKGKSFVYSQVYANEKASGQSSESYCKAYAWAFEQTVLKDKSEYFRNVFTLDFADYIAETYHDFEEAMKDEDLYIFINPIIAEAQANDYINTHKIENSKRFSNLYVNLFLSIYHSHEWLVLLMVKDIDKEVLKLTLEKFGK